ncbi:MAG: sugar phosphate nucleotidyltransferase [Thermodesulfobacteriota bacterium]|nr:sugar phosphate nucleotidyltransferase [Thermodesulfobacteriota bacterium]
MRAIILAGGKGTRLLPYTTVIPKPLMPVGGRPILEVIITQLKFNGISRITMAVGYLAELIEAYFGNGEKYGIEIDYSREEQPLGTIGSLSLIEGLDETFLVMNGDVLTNLDYGKLLSFHKEKGGVATIATCSREVNIDLGILELDRGFQLKEYIEKPTLKHHVSMGIYLFEPEMLDFIEPDTYLDFPDLVLSLIKAGRRVMAFPFDGYWLDIGRHEDYAQALEEFETMEEFDSLKEKLCID